MPRVEIWYSASKIATFEGQPPAKGSKVMAGDEAFEVGDVEWYLDKAADGSPEGLRAVVSLDKLPASGNEQL